MNISHQNQNVLKDNQRHLGMDFLKQHMVLQHHMVLNIHQKILKWKGGRKLLLVWETELLFKYKVESKSIF